MLNGTNYNNIFDEQYNKLNPAQKDAVDHIDGPVMVVAGPGTGKTQTITLRIANILKQTQLNPINILCLTFTDSAVNTMRSRLISIIGAQAYDVRIMTFHAFCNEVILAYPEKFSEFGSNIAPLNEVEKYKMFSSLLEQLPYNSSLRPFGNSDTYLFEIPKIISGYKRDNVNIATIEEEIQLNHEFFIKATPIFEEIHKIHYSQLNESVITQFIVNLQNLGFSDFTFVNYLIGLRNDYNEEKYTKLRNQFYTEFTKGFSEEITKKQLELVELFKKYQLVLKEIGKYDYDDMIVSVVNKFKTDKELLALFQEKYQYILIDEYQDTNNSQNEVLRSLGSFWIDPNIFVVGDDDQSIFRFQGASIENMIFFYNTYLSKIKIVSLTENYRTQQLILDAARAVIANNGMQVDEKIRGLSKNLHAFHQEYPQNKIQIYEYKEPIEESFAIAKKVQDLLKSGVKGKEIAIIYRDNSDALDIKEALHINKIAFRMEKGENALHHIEIRKFISFLNYLVNPENNQNFFTILNFDFWQFDKLDLLKIFNYYAKEDLVSYFDLISSNEHLTLAGVSNVDVFITFAKKILAWRNNIYNYDAQIFFNQIIRETGFLEQVLLKEDYVSVISKIARVYNELKILQVDKQSYTLVDFINDLMIYQKYHIELIEKLLGSDNDDAIRLMTVHGSKGQEFEYVFIIKCQSRKWGDNPRRNRICLPFGLLKNQFVSEEDDEERRLFYVAVTRAKKDLHISYNRFSIKQTSQQPSRFIKEFPENFVQFISNVIEQEKAGENQVALIKETSQNMYSQEGKTIINNILEGFKMSVSQVIAYRKCPRCFYFKNILKVPSAKNKASSFGSAVHETLHNFAEQKKAGIFQTEEEFIKIFVSELKKERLNSEDLIDAIQKGEHLLKTYYLNKTNEIPTASINESNFRNLDIQVAGIPITGKIDRIDFLTSNQMELNVVDYKTGNPDNASSRLSPKNLGDYLLQLYFYKLLIENSTLYKGKVIQGQIEFIEPSKTSGLYISKIITFEDLEMKRVVDLIRETYNKIIALDFNEYNKDGFNKCEHEEYHYINWLY